MPFFQQRGLLFLNLGDTYYSGKGESQGKDRKSNKRRFGLRAVDKSGGVGIGGRENESLRVQQLRELAVINDRRRG